ncbi:porin family protein [Hymenobacter cellulosilyticus]|uniref:PorT family protein n=1 Tax=Hymenobacter cellulosilyticus TaxID=2932248 RepID=A0A8T9QA50_9BACT|nr:porin family protein [Hymenobacter cellulosilyticus]UOQ73862.1 PorT family protein [Hymenobacter cellulosilyticus]
MKKYLTIAAVALAATSATQAQDSGGFRLGVKVGGTYSNISGDNVSQITGAGYNSELGSYKVGYNAGISASIPLSSDGFFSFAPELLYNRKGYEIETQSTDGATLAAYPGATKVEQEQQRVLHYLDVPLLAKINAGGLFFELGPQVSYLFGSKTKSQTTIKYQDGTKNKTDDANQGFLDYTGLSRDEADKSDLAQFDISGVAGLGYQSEGGLSVGLRYARGFNSLIDSKDTKNEAKAFNNAFTLQLGYLLPLGK